MIVRVKRESFLYYAVPDAPDLNAAVVAVMKNKGTLIAEEVGGTSFKEVFTIPDLRPLDVVFAELEPKAVQ